MWLILLAGCRDPELDSFLDDRNAAICARHARCDTLEAAGYADESDCRGALEDSTEQAREDRELQCSDFDAEAADTCLAAYEGSCDEPPDLTVCDTVCP
jgi:hypothetical protein